MTLFSILLVAQVGAVCPADADLVGEHVDAAVQAYEDWEWDSFAAGVAQVNEELACLEEIASPTLVARVHLLAALYGARYQKPDLARDAFRGLLSLDPYYEPSIELAAPGSALRQAYDAAGQAGPGDVLPLPDGSWYVDGLPDPVGYPVQRAALVQQDGQKRVRSWYLLGGDVPPELVRVESVPEPVPEPRRPERQRKQREPKPSRALLGTGLACAAVAAGSFTYAELSWAHTMDSVADQPRAYDAYDRAHAMTIGGIAAGGVASGLVLTAVIVGRW